MKCETLATIGLKNLSDNVTHDLSAPCTLLQGPNGSGKSAIIQGVQLALEGALPGLPKTGKAIMSLCSGDTLAVAVSVNQHLVTRVWERTKSGSVTEHCTVDEVRVTGKAAAGVIQMALGEAPAVANMPAFWAMSLPARRTYLLGRFGGEEAEAMLEAAVTHKKRLNEHRKTIKEAQAGLKAMNAELQALPTGSDADTLTSALESAREWLGKLNAELQEGRENDAARVRLEALQKQRPATEKKLQEAISHRKAGADALKKAAKEAKVARDLADSMQDPIHMDNATREALASILSDITAVTPCLEGEPEQILCDAGRRLFELLNVSMTQDEVRDTRAELQARASIKETERDQVKKRGVSAADAKIAQLKASLKAMDKAGSQVAMLGPGVDPAVNDAVLVQRATIQGLEATLQAASERTGMLRGIEAARLRLQGLVDEEEPLVAASNKAHQKAAGMMATIANGLKTAAAAVFPRSQLTMDEDGSLFWDGINVQALSGGEGVAFNAALGRVLAGAEGLVFIEGSELDKANLAYLMGALAKEATGQYIMAHWMEPTAGCQWPTIKLG